MDALPRLDRGQLPLTESFDEDSCGDACAMPVIPGTGGLFAGASAAAAASANSLPPFARAAAVAAARAAASAAVSSHQQHQHQQQQRYPVYGDPCSSWMVADSADGRTRIISIQAPAALAAAVAGGRASSDLTTFESYSLGAKINKALYAEANALYNRCAASCCAVLCFCWLWVREGGGVHRVQGVGVSVPKGSCVLQLPRTCPPPPHTHIHTHAHTCTCAHNAGSCRCCWTTWRRPAPRGA
jgi:hypothetical protein